MKVSNMMSTLSDLLSQHSFADRFIDDHQLARLLEGTPQRRYNLVNRALKSGDLVRLKRGHYILRSALASARWHPFGVAQVLRPGSYVSFETALAFHGWIPESVAITLSVSPGRRTETRSHPLMGEYQFIPLPVRTGYYLQGVDRHGRIGMQALIAQPIRALLDVCYTRKMDPAEIENVLDGLRLDLDSVSEIRLHDLLIMQSVYPGKRMKEIIQKFKQYAAL